MSKIETKLQVSAGGVTFKKRGGRVRIAIISVGPDNRWQLPKGLVDANESPEAAALREVREETGINAGMVGLIEKIEYWYFSKSRGERVRFHKFVYFYLLKHRSGRLSDHDREVNEARWVDIEEAARLLAFESERKVVEKARGMIEAM